LQLHAKRIYAMLLVVDDDRINHNEQVK
jgi:hypothetical protein